MMGCYGPQWPPFMESMLTSSKPNAIPQSGLGMPRCFTLSVVLLCASEVLTREGKGCLRPYQVVCILSASQGKLPSVTMNSSRPPSFLKD
eukprot:4898056-Amphidinium_carterae.1